MSHEPVEGQPLHPLVNDRLIERVDNARLRVGTAVKHADNPLFGETEPWEVRFDNLYANVTRDPDSGAYRLWYSPFIIDRATSETPRERRSSGTYHEGREQAKAGSPERVEREMGVCYAVSRDGLTWTKPALGLIEYDGSYDNNIVMRRAHGAGVMLDPVDADPQRRYKMLAHFRTPHGPSQMGVAFSPDGLRWSEPVTCPDINAPGDTHNNALWGPRQHRYIGITRLRDPETRERIVGRTQSEDFIHWTPAVEVLRGSPERQPYTMIVFAWGDVFLGLVTVFDPAADRVTCELAWSRDALEWHWLEPGQPLLDAGTRHGDYDWGCVYPAACPVVTRDAVRLYYGASNGPHTDWRDGFLALATLRPHGFVGYRPIDAKRRTTILTRPIRADAAALHVTCDARGGELRAVAVDAVGREVFRSRPIRDDVTQQPITPDATGAQDAAGDVLQWRLELENATAYAIGFNPTR